RDRGPSASVRAAVRLRAVFLGTSEDLMLGRAMVAAAFVLVSGTALADGNSFGLRASGLGLGVDYSHTFKDRVALRLGVNGSSFGFNGEESDVNYDFDVNFESVSVAADFYPGKRALHFTVGALDNSNGLDGVGVPTAPVE